MDNYLYEKGNTLEEAFFRKRDAELIEQHKKIERMKRNRETLAEVSGIHNAKVLDRLIELEVSPEVLACMAVVPLIEIAWADGQVDDVERKAVLKAASESGMKKGSVDYALLDAWLKHRPPEKLLMAWAHYIEGLCSTLSAKEIESLKSELMGKAEKIASATGGILGLAFNVSPEEKAVLQKMEHAFNRHVT